jgi:CheY-like chemotaxis protein
LREAVFSGDDDISILDEGPMAPGGPAMRIRRGKADCSKCNARTKETDVELSGRQYRLGLRGAGTCYEASGRVLIVDDEPHVRSLLLDVLPTVCDEVVAAENGADALEVVPIFQPDVILTDMTMPGMSGADFLGALRRAGVTAPVILISGQPIPMPDGFFGVLRKPFDLRKLADVVRAAMDHGRTDGA